MTTMVEIPAPWCKPCKKFVDYTVLSNDAYMEWDIFIKCHGTEYLMIVPHYEAVKSNGDLDKWLDTLNEYSNTDIEWRKVEREL